MIVAEVSIGPLTFSAPAMLLGVAAAAIPVILHLLARVHAPQVHFPTLRFLQISMQKTARHRKIQQWLVMMLRAAALALLAMALAKPFYRPFGATPLANAAGAVILIDDSMSMAAGKPGQSRFERAKQLLYDLLDEGIGIERWCVLTTSEALKARPKPLSKSQIYRKIERIRPTHTAADLFAGLTRARQFISQTGGNWAIYLLTDLQQTSLRRLQEQWKPTDDPPLFVLKVGTDEPQNVAITQLRAADPVIIQSEPASFEAEVTNYSDQAKKVTVVLEVQGDRRVEQSRTLLLEPAGRPGCQRTVAFECTFSSAGLHCGRVLIRDGSDDLKEDDQRWFVVKVRDRIRAIVCAAASPKRSGLSRSFFVETALAVWPACRAIRIPPERLDPAGLSGADLLVLCGLSGMSAEAASAVRRFVRGSGRLAVFLASGSDVETANSLFGPLDDQAGRAEPLLPVKVLYSVDDRIGRRKGRRVVKVNTTWPLLAGLFSEPEPFKEIVVHRFFALEPWPNRSQTKTLLRLEGGMPLLVAHRYGRGYVTLFATSAERTWTNLPVKPVFLPILVRLATWGMKSDWLVYQAGQAVRIRPAVALQDEGQTASPAKGSVAIIVRPPKGSGMVETSLNTTAEAAEANYDATYRSGIYTWRTSDGVADGMFAVNPPPAESDLTAGREDAFAKFWGGPCFVARDLKSLNRQVRVASRGIPWWDYLLTAVLLLSLAEGIMANRFRPTTNRSVVAA